ncbi:MAG: L-threonine 3-dehydrogenase [Chlamydiota bacterium]
MKALKKQHQRRGLDLVEAPIPQVGAEDVLIRVDKSAICGTDVNIYAWKDWSQENVVVPTTIGHEFVGTVVEVGSAVEKHLLEKRVSAEGHLTCRQCKNCLTGLMHLCPHTKGIGIHRDGCFAEYISVPAVNVIPIPSFIDDEIAAILDPLGNAVHTCSAFPLAGKTVLITGAGPIGLMAVNISRFFGASSVTICDPNPNRRAAVSRKQATMVYDPCTSSAKEVSQELALKDGFDVGLEMSGSPQALEDMIRGLRPGGQMAVLGIFPKSVPVAMNEIIFKGINLKGIYGRKMFATWYQMFSLLEAGLEIDSVITRTYSFFDYESAFSMMEEGNCGKVLFDWNAPKCQFQKEAPYALTHHR